MTLKSNDHAIVNGHPILPGDLCGHGPPDLLTFAANFQFSAQDGGLDCFCNFIAESLRKDPQDLLCTKQKWLGERITRQV